ncbi:MAG: hydrolase [Frankiales bacterium]|nr:hydrolase [Frankiales bacterium]
MPDADRPPAASLVRTADGHGYSVRAVGEGRPAIFLHGGGPGCTAESDFGATARLLAPHRRCLLVDMLQYGASDKCAVTGPRWSFHAASLAGLLDALGLDDADLVCGSWGGSAALALAAAFPSRVRSLVVTGSMPLLAGPVPAAAAGLANRVRENYYGGTGPTLAKMRDLLAEVEWADASRLPAETVRLRHEQSLDASEVALTTGAGTPRGEPEDLGEQLTRLTAPVLYLWGSSDVFVPPHYALELTGRTPGASLHVMAGTAHHPYEERPAAFAAIASAFLDSASA